MLADRSQYYEQSNDDLDMQDNQESQIIVYEKIIEREAPMLYHKIDSEKRMKFLVYYLNFCMHRNVDELMNSSHPSAHKKVSRIESIGMTDTHVALCFIKGLFGGSTSIVTNVGLMLTCSSLVAYYWPSSAESVNTTLFANSLLRKALKKQPSFIQRFLIGIKIKEIEVNADEKTRLMFEAKHLVSKLERRQQELKALHRNFWKELTHEVVNYEKIESIILRASELSSKCETHYENLRLTYRHDKSLLRSHAQFLETCRFDPDIAHEMYNEASLMEEEDSANHAMKSKSNLMATVNIAERRKMWRDQAKNRPNNRGMANGNVKVVPVNGNKDMVRGDSTSSIEGKEGQEEYGHHFEMIDPRTSLSYSDQLPFDGVENFGNVRKETIFRTSLSVPHRHTFQLGGFIAFFILSVCLLISSSILSGLISYEVTDDLQIVKTGCIPTSSIVQMITKLRSLKFANSLYSQKSWPTEMTSLGFKNLTDFNTKMWTDFKQYYSYFIALRDMSMKDRVLTPTMYDEFHERYYPMLTPEISSGSEIILYNSTKAVNISIADITNLVIKYSEDLIRTRDSDHTFTNYGFMFFYDNHDYITKAFSQFCSVLIDESKHEASQVDIAYMAFLIVALVVYLLYGTGYIIYTHISLKFVKSQIKLIEHEISKNIAGRLFHDLEKKVSDDVTVRLPKSKLLRPKNIIIMLSISLMILMAVCAGLLYFGNRYNAEKIASSFISFRHATNSMFYVQRIAFAVTEQFTNKVLGGSLQSSEELYLMNQDLEENVQSLRENWNLCLYGDSKEVYTSIMNRGILGLFSEVDNLIIGESNCTFSEFRYSYNVSSKCFLSLNSLLTDYMSLSTQFNSVLKVKNINSSDMDIVDQYAQATFLSNMITMDVVEISSVISENYSNPAFEILITFSIVGSVSILLFSYLIHLYLTKYWNSIQEMRLYFNYISVETLDSNEALRNYCIHHLVNDTFLLKRRNMNNTSLQDSKVRSLLNASVDGAVMCSGQTCDIDIFNPAAQRMFGYNQTETVGRPLFDLFDSLSQQSIRKMVSDMLQGASEAQSKGDALDAECVRKNQTTFPARANIFLTKHDNKPIITIFIKDITSEKKHLALIAEEKKHSEELLLNILPDAVASKLKSGETFIAEKFADITCFFSDMVNFTRISSDMNPSELVLMLNFIVNGFDELITKYNLEKIKTIGDAYFAVGGLHGLNAQSDHPERTLKFAIDTYQVVSNYNSKSGKPMREQINIRIGMHTGSVVAGVIGKLKFAYDLWGDTINMASRMESNSVNGRIQISRTTYERVYDLGFSFEERTINVKGKGETLAYLLDSKHHTSAIVNHEVIEDSEEIESVVLPPRDTLEVIPLRESASNHTDLVDLAPSTP
ncbi:predicted protein [Naegleria gruberi]|uniref:Predicted protein n=1 Tax=Naegleria gruberi TaxID=5762 RepID=D2VIN1_NAEGR|nr:uncharacterized protein NAEGRDRAFT_68736 [Naegleria gruberi]EFC43302.1 predicted protein [Naegleria gruberi]|eukprot:XP_002676046.1 predicted protein [Naegleria gruberi strain NEG-M]